MVCCLGRLQRRVLRCFIATGDVLPSSDLAAWCWPRLDALDREHRVSMMRAAKSVGARRVRREGRVWIWRLETAAQDY
jgi:hypothetical protein